MGEFPDLNCIGESVRTGVAGLNAVDCHACGYVHLFPKPAQGEVDRLYRDEFYQSHNAGWFEKEAREQWYWRKMYRARMKQNWTLLQSAPPQGGARWWALDVGAGCGWFIHAMRKEDWWEFRGMEPSAYALRWALKNLEIGLYPWCSVGLWGRRWNFVHASLVFEHLVDPLKMLEEIRHSLVPRGILCIVVPNEFNPLQQRLSKRYGYTPFKRHHLNYFTPETLKALAERAGFKVVRETATFPIEWFALHGLNYVRHPRFGTVAHWLRMFIEYAGLSIAPKRWERLRDAWAARGIGREIELWLRKPKANGS